MSKANEAFRTISEVADELEIPKHVLRFWEVKFNHIKPMKRGGGRRYYRPEDLQLLRGIRHLLHREGYTIKGVQKILREHGVDAVKQHGRDPSSVNLEIKAPDMRAIADGPAAPKPAPQRSSRPQRQPVADSVSNHVSNPQRKAAGGPAAMADAPPPSSRQMSSPRRQPELTAKTRDHVRRLIAELQECRALLAGSGPAPTANSARLGSARG